MKAQEFAHRSAQGAELRAIGEEVAAAGSAEQKGGRIGLERCALFFVARDEIDAVRSGPEFAEAGVVQENVGRIGEKRAIPEAIDAPIEDEQLLAGIEADGGGIGEFAVAHDTFAGLEALLDGDRELFGTEDGIKNAEGEVGALDEDDHHGDQGIICGDRPAPAAEEPIQKSAEEESDGGTDERATEESHGVAGEVQEVAERKRVHVGVLVEGIKNIGAGGRRVGGNGKEAGCGGDQETESEKNGGGAAARAGKRRSKRSLGFSREPIADEKGETGQTGGDVILLTSGKAEEEKDDSGPAEEQK